MKNAIARQHSGLNAQSQQDDDWLSALLDGELDDDAAAAALSRLRGDSQGGRRFAEYALIGDALRGDALDSGRFQARFKAALADEPTVLAPVTKTPRMTAASALWLAAAATVVAITWTVLESAPDSQPGIPMAQAPQLQPQLASAEVMPYLAAHQDYAHAVVATPEMRFTPVSLSEADR